MLALTAGKPPIPRAPRGGAVSPVNDRFYRGGWFMPRVPILPAGTALAFDLTRDDLVVTIANPATGGSRTFRVETLEYGELAGKRIASILTGENPFDRFAWTGFAWADDFGLTPWHRFKSDKKVTGPNGYLALLTESSRFAATGIEYRVSL